MLSEKWEKYATDIANVTNDDLIEKLMSIGNLENIDKKENACVLVARDTRSLLKVWILMFGLIMNVQNILM